MPNSAVIKVWGLSAATRARIEAQDELTCRIHAGYGTSPGQIFFGVVQHAETVLEREDRVLRVSLDEEGGNEYMSREVSIAVPKGTPLRTVLLSLINATGMKLGNAAQLDPRWRASGANVTEGSYVAHGSAVFELNIFCQSCGIDWSFQEGQFMGAPTGQAYRSDGPLLTPKTGLLDARLDRRGNIEGRALLNADIMPGVGFRIENETLTGDFIASATVHDGDNYDPGNWHVGFHGIPLGATSEGLLPEKKKKTGQ